MKSYSFARLLAGLFLFIAVSAAAAAAFAFFGLPGPTQMRIVTAATFAGVAFSLAAAGQMIQALVDTAANTERSAEANERIERLTTQLLEQAQRQARAGD